jgi:hypothetical protein
VEKTTTFQFTQLMEAHEGSRGVLRLIDDDLRRHLELLEAMGVFDSSAVILMSDHGNHMGPFFELTRQGQIERAMPTLMMSLPVGRLIASRSDAKDVLEYVRENQRQPIVTAFDVHATLRDLLGLPPLEIPVGSMNRNRDTTRDFQRAAARFSVPARTATRNPFGSGPVSPLAQVPTLQTLERLGITDTIAGQSLLRPFNAYTSCGEAGAQVSCSANQLCFSDANRRR